MASVPEAFFDAVVGRFNALLPGHGISFAFGHKAWADNIQWPRARCLKANGAWEPYDRDASAPWQQGAPTETKYLYGRRVLLLWHLWAADDETAEIMIANLVIAGHEVAVSGSVNNFRPIGDEWPQEEPSGIDLASGGAYAILGTEIVMRLDNNLTAMPQVAIAAQEHQSKFSAPGEDIDAGEIVC